MLPDMIGSMLLVIVLQTPAAAAQAGNATAARQAFDEGNARCGVHFEVKPALHQNSEEPVGLIQPVSAEHRFGAQVGQGAQLVEDEGFEGIVRHLSMGSFDLQL